MSDPEISLDRSRYRRSVDRHAWHIHCGECQGHLLFLEDGCLLITARHHGRSHTTRLKLADLVRLNQQLEQTCASG